MDESTVNSIEQHAAGEVLPNWLVDGQRCEVAITGLSAVAGMPIAVHIGILDEFEVWTHMVVPAVVDQEGHSAFELADGLSVGIHAGVYVDGIEVDQRFVRFENVLVSIVNSPSPGESLEEVVEQYRALEMRQAEVYEVPLGDPSATGSIEHRGLVLIDNLFTTVGLNFPGGFTRPLRDKVGELEIARIANSVLRDLSWATVIDESRWADTVSRGSHLTVVVCPTVYAASFEEAFELIRETAERVATLLSLHRGSGGRPVATILEQRQRNGGVSSRVFPPAKHYSGNLIGGAIAGESQRDFVTEYQTIDHDPLVRLCCDLYAEALAERSIDARFFRFWSILEVLAGARVEPGAPVARMDGSQWPDGATTAQAEPRVYEYLRNTTMAVDVDEAGRVRPAADLYEAVRVWYARRNATGHYGRFLEGDATQMGQRWYQWAVRSALNAHDWCRALEHLVGAALRSELHAPRGSTS